MGPGLPAESGWWVCAWLRRPRNWTPRQSGDSPRKELPDRARPANCQSESRPGSFPSNGVPTLASGSVMKPSSDIDTSDVTFDMTLLLLRPLRSRASFALILGLPGPRGIAPACRAPANADEGGLVECAVPGSVPVVRVKRLTGTPHPSSLPRIGGSRREAAWPGVPSVSQPGAWSSWLNAPASSA